MKFSKPQHAPAMLRALATLSPVSIMTCSASAGRAWSLNRCPRTGNQPSHLEGPLVRQLPCCRASSAAALLLLTWSSNVNALQRWRPSHACTDEALPATQDDQYSLQAQATFKAT